MHLQSPRSDPAACSPAPLSHNHILLQYSPGSILAFALNYRHTCRSYGCAVVVALGSTMGEARVVHLQVRGGAARSWHSHTHLSGARCWQVEALCGHCSGVVPAGA